MPRSGSRVRVPSRALVKCAEMLIKTAFLFFLCLHSSTYFGGDEWLDRIGTKFVEAVEDQTIERAAEALLKAK